MELSEYQKQSRVTAIYDDAGNNFVYPTLGLAGETGEVVEKIKKLMRNNGAATPSDIDAASREELSKEIGDVLWYLAQLATELQLDLGEVAEKNIEKLTSRMNRGALHSEGDNR